MASKGAPKGNNNAGKGKDWTHALEWALDNYSSSTIKKAQALRAIANTVIQKAIEGDHQSIQEIGNRIEGKPTEHKHVTGNVAHDHSGLPTPSEILAGFAGESPESSDEAPTTH